jgi:hypothetical protein
MLRAVNIKGDGSLEFLAERPSLMPNGHKSSIVQKQSFEQDTLKLTIAKKGFSRNPDPRLTMNMPQLHTAFGELVLKSVLQQPNENDL